MKKRLLLVKPLDWLAFRTSRTFSSSGDTQFPNTKTFYGAIYAELYRKNILTPKEIKDKIKMKKLDLTGPFLFEKNDEIKILFRTPSILKYNEDTKETLMGYIDEKIKYEVDGKELNGIRYKSMKNIKELENYYITLKELEKIKNGELIENKKPIELPYRIERKVGIELETGKRKTKKGMLYSLSYYRFKENSGFCFFIENDEEEILKDIKTIHLGTKGKIAELEIIEIETNLFNKVETTQKMAILLTPAYFEKGVMPKENKNLIGISNYKPETIGYWDRETNKPSELFKVVPSGSTYIFKEEIPKYLTDDYDHYGFGKYIEIKGGN
ncbi:type III-B CRISPR module-associated protein Cmr3 [Tepiditoga spiralis]|uniref:Type III-B CRISPR module-associated protein Cmr3 n=1 Tax=Tepiditoga spiralis TaxID=2108365 RepID=A0A7G1G6G1_9BACT|nr:type III-B CRISPR module-associated protein Cmr3 [Tepiditoga spiralis]BBE31755.1 type III-B CRISPR module-associated protein Cmr3 [Tepiditoga spiralis]